MGVKRGVVYILANRKNGALYTGVTSDLPKRIHQHRTKATGGFTADYDVQTLVWVEVHDRIDAAIHREKQIKKWNRAWKIALIEAENPDWTDLAVGLFGFAPLSRPSRESGNPSPAGPEMDSRFRGNDESR